MMKKLACLILGLLLIALPAQAQDPDKVPDPAPAVAAVTTFSQLKVTIKKESKYQLVAVISDAGDFAYQQTTTKIDANLRRKTIFEGSGKLPAADLTALKKAFANLNFDKLADVAPDTEPESWISIQCSHGEQILTYRAILDNYGNDADRVNALLQIVTKIIEETIQK